MVKEVEHRGLGRRQVLQIGGGGLLAAASLGLLAGPAQASVEGATKWMEQLIGQRKPAAGRVRIEMPQIAENGNAVPLTVSAESPMTADNYVKAIHVIADGNPQPEVASFMFTPECGKAEVSARMRLAQTQNIWAVAEMSDGSVHMEKTEVKVTIGGCGG